MCRLGAAEVHAMVVSGCLAMTVYKEICSEEEVFKLRSVRKLKASVPISEASNPQKEQSFFLRERRKSIAISSVPSFASWLMWVCRGWINL